MAFKEILKNKQALIAFCKNNFKYISSLQRKNLKKTRSINSKEHDEIFPFFSFIYDSINNPFWTYPVTIIYDDKPDFIIEYTGKKVSLEVTSQKATNWRGAKKKGEKNGVDVGDTYFEGDIKEKGRPKYTDAEIKDKDSYSAPPSMRDDAEIFWVERTKYTIIEKNKKAKKYPNINSFSNHILLIFDFRPESMEPAVLSESIFDNSNFYQECSTTLFERVVCIDGNIIDIDLKNNQFKYCGRNKANSLIQNKENDNQ